MTTLLELAQKKYNSKDYDWGGPSEGPGPYDGTKDIDANGRLDIDCSHLVHNALVDAGYDIPYLPTKALNSEEALKYFSVVPLDEATKDDLVLFPGHVRIYSGFDPSAMTGEFFGSQSRGPGMARFDPSGRCGWKINFHILRPKKEFLIRNHSPAPNSVRKSNRWSTEVPRSANKVRWRLEADQSSLMAVDRFIRWQR